MSRVYRVGEFAERVGRSVSTARRWESEGRLVARRTATNQRYFDESDVQKVLRPGFGSGKCQRVVVYCRVSSPGQKDDLASQVEAMQQFCLGRGLAVEEWVSEIGGGMNLVEDLLAVVHTFSCRLYRLRRYEKTLKAELKSSKAGGA